MTLIVLDSTPLGLIGQKRDYRQAEECREWAQRHVKAGDRLVVPEIVDYEVRRELLRLRKLSAVRKLEAFNAARPDRFLPLTSAALRRAAELWAQARQQGKPTADAHALDIDVILAAQILTSQFDLATTVVATSNVAHLTRFVPAEEWSKI